MNFKFAAMLVASLLATGAQAAVLDNLGASIHGMSSMGNGPAVTSAGDGFSFKFSAKTLVDYNGAPSGAEQTLVADDSAAGLLSFAKTSGSSFSTRDLSKQHIRQSFVTANGDPSVIAEGDSATDAAAPLPEPETYAMLAAGLGIVGFVASRRRRND